MLLMRTRPKYVPHIWVCSNVSMFRWGQEWNFDNDPSCPSTIKVLRWPRLNWNAFIFIHGMHFLLHKCYITYMEASHTYLFCSNIGLNFQKNFSSIFGYWSTFLNLSVLFYFSLKNVVSPQEKENKKQRCFSSQIFCCFTKF